MGYGTVDPDDVCGGDLEVSTAAYSDKKQCRDELVVDGSGAGVAMIGNFWTMSFHGRPDGRKVVGMLEVVAAAACR